MRTILIFSVFLLTSCNASATITPGAINLMEECPGVARPARLDGNEGLGMAVLSPILSFAVNQGLKTAGKKLQDLAKEATVDVLQHGDHFYKWNNGKWNIQHACMIVASKEMKTTSATISESYGDYAHSDELVAEVSRLGFAQDEDARSKPGFTAVFDVELSAQGSEFRLKPSWVGMSHSIREKKADRYPRDVTLEIAYAIPGVAEPITSMVKFEGIKTEHAVQFGHTATQWMPVPILNQSEITKQQSLAEFRGKQATFAHAAALAGAAANALGAESWTPPDEDNVWDPIETGGSCPALTAIPDEWGFAHSLHAAESAKISANQDAGVLAMLSNIVSYFENCSKSQGFAEKIAKAKPAEGHLARAYDLTVTIKEFRKRPVAQFFGDVLSDDGTRSALASTILSEIDPLTKETAKKEAEVAAATAQLAALGTYEQARLDAEQAIIEYNDAPAAQKAAKLLTMEFKKRAANRAADAVGVDQPYPDKRTWVQ